MNDRQKQILSAINDYIKEHGYPPTIREIARNVGLAPSSVHVHLKKLQELGYIEKMAAGPRPGIYAIGTNTLGP